MIMYRKLGNKNGNTFFEKKKQLNIAIKKLIVKLVKMNITQGPTYLQIAVYRFAN